jgi:hypothetical protein
MKRRALHVQVNALPLRYTSNWFFEAGSHYVAQDGLELELTILLSPLPKCRGFTGLYYQTWVKLHFKDIGKATYSFRLNFSLCIKRLKKTNKKSLSKS